ncbi:MAG: sugar ABC transporter substrate-binding protein, partial [Clostridiaceae bacterium]|nr:sugar ABC transporter substrate-binding protein [Clostridiaceae bacterium]
KKFRGMKVVANYKCGDNYDLSYKTIKELLRQKPNIRGVIFHGDGLLAVAKAIEELGLAGKVFILCFGINYEIAQYIKKGIICASIMHDPFCQGHDPIIHFYNILVTGKKPENKNIWTRFGVIDKNNVDDML